ncbi:MAG: cytochrome B5 [Alphaproteobacteria bacterium]|nr:MAG: cytochrome B5 [Alphaproteobacteria bacterium]
MSESSSPPVKAEHVAGDPPPARISVQRVFTSEELAAYDGSVSGRPVLIGYKGYVYDVTGRFMWMAGRHFWLRAGHDLTGRMTDSPHGEEILERVPRVGILAARPD